MRVQIHPLDFLGQGALLEPTDPKLHDAAVEYCARELQNGRELNLAKFAKAWVVTNGDGVCGISGFQWKIDIPVFRVTGLDAGYTTMKLIERMRAYFQDNGARGAEVFLHISSKETPEQRCAKWTESLAAVGAEPADRYTVKV